MVTITAVYVFLSNKKGLDTIITVNDYQIQGINCIYVLRFTNDFNLTIVLNKNCVQMQTNVVETNYVPVALREELP